MPQEAALHSQTNASPEEPTYDDEPNDSTQMGVCQIMDDSGYFSYAPLEYNACPPAISLQHELQEALQSEQTYASCYQPTNCVEPDDFSQIGVGQPMGDISGNYACNYPPLVTYAYQPAVMVQQNQALQPVNYAVAHLPTYGPGPFDSNQQGLGSSAACYVYIPREVAQQQVASLPQTFGSYASTF